MRARGFSFLRSSFSLSVLLHALFLVAWIFLAQQQAALRPSPRPLTWIEVDPYPRDKFKPKDESQSRRIVQTVQGERKDKAAPDAFLGERTQTVDLQTVGK